MNSWELAPTENPASEHSLPASPHRVCFTSSSQSTRTQISLQEPREQQPSFVIYSAFDLFTESCETPAVFDGCDIISEVLFSC